MLFSFCLKKRWGLETINMARDLFQRLLLGRGNFVNQQLFFRLHLLVDDRRVGLATVGWQMSPVERLLRPLFGP